MNTILSQSANAPSAQVSTKPGELHHSWLNRNRALLIRWSKKDNNHLALLMLASGLIAFKKARTATLAANLPG
jgi:hypothetical protein